MGNLVEHRGCYHLGVPHPRRFFMKGDINMKMSKILLLSPLMVLGATSLTGCSKTDFVVGVCQLVAHPALDAATEGFKQALESKMQEAGKSITIDIQNASGDSAVCSTIVNKFVSGKYNLIMANATPALQAAQAATTTIPILGTSITEYGVATGMPVKADGSLGINISGTSDLAPLTTQASLMNQTLPATSVDIGICYCSAEANSRYQAEVMKSELEALGKHVTISTFADTNELNSVVTNSAANNDALFIPTDNVCADNAQAIHNICRSANVPVFAGEEGICKGCGYATLSISYENIGKITGEMAARILLDGADVKTMKIEYDANPIKKYNPTICAELGMDTAALEALGFVAMDTNA